MANDKYEDFQEFYSLLYRSTPWGFGPILPKKFNNFSAAGPISDLKVSLDRDWKDLKHCFRNSPLGVTPRTLRADIFKFI